MLNSINNKKTAFNWNKTMCVDIKGKIKSISWYYLKVIWNIFSFTQEEVKEKRKFENEWK